MFKFTRSEASTGKHHLDSHPSPVTVAELTARECSERLIEAAEIAV